MNFPILSVVTFLPLAGALLLIFLNKKKENLLRTIALAVTLLTFIISLFRPNVQLYEVHNNGGWYNFGFIHGVMIIFGGGAKGSSSRRSRD